MNDHSCNPDQDRRECASAGSLLLDSHYGELDSREAARVQAHVAGCSACARRQEEWRRVERLLSSPGVTAALAPMASRAPARPVDARTVAYGVLFCEGAMILAATLFLTLPLLESRMAAAIRLTLPGLLTALSGSALVGLGAALGFRNQGRPIADALSVAAVHALLLLPTLACLGTSGSDSAVALGRIGFLAFCVTTGLALGLAAHHLERGREPSIELRHEAI